MFSWIFPNGWITPENHTLWSAGKQVYDN